MESLQIKAVAHEELNDFLVAQIQAMLKQNSLPYEDILLSKVDFLLAYEHDTMIGCIGLEKYRTVVLLRSFVVTDAYKGKGIGTSLLSSSIENCQKTGVQTLHLLTTTAASYFEGKGFVKTDRQLAPEVLLSTKEFADICPASAVYMTLKL